MSIFPRQGDMMAPEHCGLPENTITYSMNMDIADNLNLDESDLDENFLENDDGWDEWDSPINVFGAGQDEMVVESDEDDENKGGSKDNNSSDDDSPLVNLIPKGKERNERGQI
ncbi:hypothetical protein JTB14_033510 [Gonioctena quinquepunctata]|nr:hypothetical protein JTB14_033510 [Gonioctena quinquepunctata]